MQSLSTVRPAAPAAFYGQPLGQFASIACSHSRGLDFMRLHVRLLHALVSWAKTSFSPTFRPVSFRLVFLRPLQSPSRPPRWLYRLFRPQIPAAAEYKSWPPMEFVPAYFSLLLKAIF
ncbi:hypothetical protein MRB53_039982 [Persea americana]|nr:hypothetical protein MRB53_039982 [Persea americana]